MRIATSSLLSLLLPGTNAARNRHKRRRHHHHHNNNNKSINSSLIRTKSLTQTTSTATTVAQHVFPWQPRQPNGNIYRSPFGPKQRSDLCDVLTTTAPSFDVDSSAGLDWNEFYAFLSSVVDAVADDGSTISSSGRMNARQMGKVYHDLTCECHYTYRFPLTCCHVEESSESDSPQSEVTLLGLDANDDSSYQDKQYRKNFCNGIMYILENEGIDLEIVADAIGNGLNVNVTDVPWNEVDAHDDDDESHVVDQSQGQESSAGGSTIATVVTSVSADEESFSNTETLSTESPVITSLGDDVDPSTITNETEDEDSALDSGSSSSNIITDNSDESTTDSSPSTESYTESTLSSSTTIETIETSSNNTTKPLPLDASTSSIMSASTADSTANNKNAGLSIGAAAGILLAIIALLLAAITAVVRRKRRERRRLAEFAGEDSVPDDLDAESVPKETAGGDKAYAEWTPDTDTSAENPLSAEETSGSEASSVVSVEHDEECAQISFEEQEDGGVEARVTVGSTLAAMGVASTVTGRLSAPRGKTDV
ncbi:hypothetical protein ACHAW6_012231 [Cyclotella cf. meneghiniana]